MSLLFLLVSVLYLTVFGIDSADKGPVLVVIGDSWGSYGHEDLQKVLTKHGSNLTVKSYAIGGTTSTFWARDPNLVNELVSENPTAEYVWLSIGGNDVIDFMPDCTKKNPVETCINIILPRVMNNTQAFLDPLVKNHPNIKIVQFGYDVPNLDENALCRNIGENIIYGCNDSAPCINPQFVKIQYLYVDALPAIYPNNLQSINLLGSLQAQDKFVGVTLGHPDLSKWSPADLMESNCIHPTRVGRGTEPAGFDVIFNNMWDVYFSKQ